MQGTEFLNVIGLMSGTSMDGVDAAILRTNGDEISEFGATVEIPYDAGFRDRLRDVVGKEPEAEFPLKSVEKELTEKHALAVDEVVKKSGKAISDFHLVGFHGQTVFHAPERGITCQIGDGQLLANLTGISVVNDFRTADVKSGGEGAPLAPVYHAALSRTLERPVAVLNIGGVANVTWISPDGGVIAFDTGPGNALIDDWVRQNTNRDIDENGVLARRGKRSEMVLNRYLEDAYFTKAYPKSLDRDNFSLEGVRDLSPEDGAASLTAFTAEAVALSEHLLPSRPLRWLVCGGGRHNRVLMAELRRVLDGAVEPVEAVGSTSPGSGRRG